MIQSLYICIYIPYISHVYEFYAYIYNKRYVYYMYWQEKLSRHSVKKKKQVAVECA